MNESTITGNISTGYTIRKPEPTITVAGRVFTFDEAIELYEALKKLFARETPTFTWSSTSEPYLLKTADDTRTQYRGCTQSNKG